VAICVMLKENMQRHKLLSSELAPNSLAYLYILWQFSRMSSVSEHILQFFTKSLVLCGLLSNC